MPRDRWFADPARDRRIARERTVAATSVENAAVVVQLLPGA
jgi:hypothetical protein